MKEGGTRIIIIPAKLNIDDGLVPSLNPTNNIVIYFNITKVQN